MRPGFDPNSASTWNEDEQAVYWTGHREGESECQVGWEFALDAHCCFDLEVVGHTPEAVAKYIRTLEDRVAAGSQLGI